jgi:HAD superfamily hydrolase (TIGR01450 family)
VFVVGESGIAQALESVGARPTFDEDVSSVDLVVAGIDREFTYAKLRTAQRLILAGAKFIATNRDSTFPTESGVTPGAGSLVAAIETASGVIPVSMGKPEPTMLQLLLERLQLRPEQAAMIGDRLDTDIACAHRAGVGKIFVATGVTTMQTARAAAGDWAADVFVDDLPALLALWDAQ